MSSGKSLHTAQDDLIAQLNQLLEEDAWYEASKLAYEALTLDPDYGRAANALLRCYLHRDVLRELQRVLSRLFSPEDPDYDAPHQRRRRLAYSYRGLSTADLWLEWHGHDPIPAPLTDVTETLEEGIAALTSAYLVGEEGAYERAQAAFARAQNACADPTALAWYLARLYADRGFFAESAEMLADLVAAQEDPHVQRLWAEVTWWQTYGERLPWIY